MGHVQQTTLAITLSRYSLLSVLSAIQMGIYGTFSLSIIGFCIGSLWTTGLKSSFGIPPASNQQCDCPIPEKVTSQQASSGENNGNTERSIQQRQEEKSAPSQCFNPSLHGLAVGAARTNTRLFTQTYDTGIPYDDSSVQDVLILYSEPQSLPSNLRALTMEAQDHGIPELSAEQATQNCDLMNVLYVQRSGGERQCLAILGHYEDSTIFSKTFMRVKKQNDSEETTRVRDATEILRHVGQGVSRRTGDDFYKPPSLSDTQFHYQMMRRFLKYYDQVILDVKKIASRIAKQNTVVAITTNKGYSDLLMNFVCQARSRGINLNNVLVFATDQETKNLAEGMGLAAYYGEHVSSSFTVTH